MTLLHIDSSILGEHSVSRQLSAAIVKQFTDAKPDTSVIHLELADGEIGHLSSAEFLALRGVEATEASAQQKVATNRRLLDDFLAAEVVVIAAPMYNFTLPSQLKAWLDRIIVAGETFQYTENGPKGLAGGKRVIVASSRGGIYSEGSPAAFLDHQENYLRNVFGFLGVTDLTFIRAEGVAMSDDNRGAALNNALSEIRGLAV